MSHVGPYLLGEVLGAGAMGQVYRARHELLDTEYALKVIRLDLIADPDLEQRFVREFRLLAQVSGRPGIVSVHTAGRHGQALYYVMDLIEGEDLHQRLRLGALAPEQAAEVMRGVAQAIHTLHLAGILHRDLKPANVLLDAEGAPWLVDFGLAKALLDESNRLTLTGELLGTPAFMAPEQIRSEAPTAKTDVYALGAMLFNLIAGHPPIQGTTAMEVMALILEGELPRLDSVAPDSPKPLVDLCAQALAHEMDSRPTAEEFAQALTDFLGSRPDEQPDDHPGRAWRIPAVAGVAVGLLGGAILMATLRTPAQPAPVASAPTSRLPARTPSKTPTRAPKLEPRVSPAALINTAKSILRSARKARAEPVRAARLFAKVQATLREISGPDADSLRVSAEAGAKVAIGRLARGGLIETKTVDRGDLLSLAFSRDGRQLVVGTDRGRVRVLAYPALRSLSVLGGKGAKTRVVAFSALGQVIYSRDDAVLVHDPPRWAAGATWKATAVVRSLAVSPQGNLLAMADDDGGVSLIGLEGRGAIVKAWRAHKKKVSGVAFSPNGRWLATGSSDRTLRLWSIPFSTGPTLALDPKVRKVLWSRAGYLIALGEDGVCRLWKAGTWQAAGRLSGPRMDPNDAALSPDGAVLVAVSDNGRIELWNLRERKHLHSFRAHDDDDVDACVFAPGGKTFFTGSEDGVLQHWRHPQKPPSLAGFREDPQAAVQRALQALGVK